MWSGVLPRPRGPPSWSPSRVLMAAILILIIAALPATQGAPSLGTEADCFRMYPNKQLDTDREKIRLSITVEQCQEKCLHEHDFLCLSFDYIAEGSVCITSPESSYTAPHMLLTSSKADHYERMLDCDHYHLPESSLKQLKEPKQEQRLMVHGDGGGVTGEDVLMQKGMVGLDDIPDVPPKENDTSPVLVFVGKNGQREESGMKARHKKDSHSRPVPEAHRARDTIKNRHAREAHFDENQENFPSILQSFIHSIHHEGLRERHLRNHDQPVHESHGFLRQRTDHTHESQEVANHGPHAQHEDPRERHVEEIHSELANRHSKHTNSKDQYIKQHAINQQHIDAASMDELNRAMHEERHQRDEHKQHLHQQDQLMRAAHREELLRVQHDETHHGDQTRQKKHAGLREDHLKSAHDEELLRVVHEEGRHKRHTDVVGKQKHTLGQEHSQHPMKEDILQAALEEKLNSKHRGTSRKVHQHGLDETHLKSAHEEELLRATHEEKHHSQQQRNTRHSQGLNDNHLKSAHDEELLRVTHEEKHRSARSPKSLHAFNEDHLRSAAEDDLLRVTHDEKYHGTRKTKEHDHQEREIKPVKYYDPSHKVKHTQHEDTHAVDKRAKKHEGCAGKSQVHDLDKRHLDAAQQEEVMRIKHDETHHAEPDTLRIKRHELNEDHLKRAHQDEMLRFKHEERHADKKRSHDDHMESASREELLRVQGEERSSRHGRGRREHLAFDERHLQSAHQEELARVQHDERFHERKSLHKNSEADHSTLRFAGLDQDRTLHRRQEADLRQSHLDLAHQEELLRMRIDEDLLTEEERLLREASVEEESGSGSGSEPIGSGDEGGMDEGSGSGNWHWGPKEEFIEEEPVDLATRNRLLVEDSDVWDVHAD